MRDGHFIGSDGALLTRGEDVVIALLKRCLVWADLVLEK